VTNVGAKVIPWIPAPARRVLSGGRSVIIDGNTLDPTLQLMLSGMRLAGIDGLVVDDDPAVSRIQFRERLTGFPDLRFTSRSTISRYRGRPVRSRRGITDPPMAGPPW